MLPEAQPFYLVDRSSQTITYNAYKCPIDINEVGKERISFGYNAMHDRSVMYYGSTATSKLTRPFRKFYSADGSMEIKYTLTTNSYEFVTYLGGDAYSAPAVVKSDGTTQNIFYLHRDNQSSILTVSNSTGTVIERRLFDAWGQLARFEKNGVEVAISSLNATNGIFLDRGYTGHEHLLGVGLINMNARLYDPKLRRFLQTDNEVQDLTDAQNYNRYGYCLNNPLKYTDPSGNHPIVIAVIISAMLYVGKALIFNEHINAMGLITSSLTTGFTAVATFGIGTMVNTIGNFALKTTVQTLAHGVFNGGLAAISGGNFWQGFAAGAVSSLASSLYTGGQNTTAGADGQRYGIAETGLKGFGGSSGFGQITFGTNMGGVGAALTGGNFWQGAVTGLVVSGLNHAMHQGDGIDDNGYDEKGNKVNDKGGDDTDYLYRDSKIIGSKKVFSFVDESSEISSDFRAYGVKIQTDGTGLTVSEGLKSAGLMAAFGKASEFFTSATGGLKQCFRYGPSFSRALNMPISKSIRWGASPKYLNRIGSDHMQMMNYRFRNMKLPGNNWRVNDPGHFHLKR